MGSGHLRDGFGVPYQLASLGVQDVAVLLPWDREDSCSELTPGLADAVFGVDASKTAPPPERPRLGILLEQAEQGVAVREVVKGSIAEQAGIRSGDIIEAIAGRKVGETADVIATVQRQAPGTWLPLTVNRNGTPVELVARFPAAP
jgi:S1-C subfamily serine protease